MNKKEVAKLAIQELKRERDSLNTSLHSAKQAAIEAPGAMQSHSDTTKFQMNALAGDLQQHMTEKELAIRTLKEYIEKPLPSNEVVTVGSLVQTTSGTNEQTLFFVLPEGNGVRFNYQNTLITIITPRSPLARALLQKKKNEHALFESPVTHAKKDFLITEIW
ncbi:MAG: GreA/GreB family elongation factor [Patescibacteria group bacterium]|nr:GreA/GreB family elongation factor [Patescibacteria group bacterium]